MPQELTRRVRQMIIGLPSRWIKEFDVREYVQNPPMIEKLYEEKQLWLSWCHDLNDQVNDLSPRLHECETRNRLLEQQLETAKRHSCIAFFLTLSATIFVGLGINIVTDTPDNWVGWVLIGFSVINEVIAFLLTVLPKGLKS